MAESWQRMVNVVLYKVQFEADLGDPEVAGWLAADLIREPLGGATPEEEIAVLGEALRSGASLTAEAIPQPHGDREVRRFLAGVVDRMKALRQPG